MQLLSKVLNAIIAHCLLVSLSPLPTVSVAPHRGERNVQCLQVMVIAGKCCIYIHLALNCYVSVPPLPPIKMLPNCYRNLRIVAIPSFRFYNLPTQTISHYLLLYKIYNILHINNIDHMQHGKTSMPYDES